MELMIQGAIIAGVIWITAQTLEKKRRRNLAAKNGENTEVEEED